MNRIKMYLSDGSSEIEVLPSKVKEMKSKGWALDKPKAKPTKESK